MVLGIGFGWNRDEAADHGIEFADRREIAREHVLCMQALWSQDQAEFHGHHISLDACWSWPKPVQQPRITTLIGGGANPSVFRAVAEYADGWMPVGGAGLGEALPTLRRAVEERVVLRVRPGGPFRDGPHRREAGPLRGVGGRGGRAAGAVGERFGHAVGPR